MYSGICLLVFRRKFLSLSSGKIKHITLPSSAPKTEAIELSEILVRQKTGNKEIEEGNTEKNYGRGRE
jgi:hypothetical protein